MLGVKSKKKPKNVHADGKLHRMPADELFDVLEESPLTVVAFYKKGQHESNLQLRALRDLAKEYRNKILFAAIDAIEAADILDSFEIDRIPSLLFAISREEIWIFDDRLTQSECKSELEELIEEFS